MQSLRDAGENGTPFRTRFVANSNDTGKGFAGPEHVEHGFGLVFGNVNSDLTHGLHYHGVQLSRFKPGAVRHQLVAARLLQERLGHLAARAVMDANKENVFHSHEGVSVWEQQPRSRTAQHAGTAIRAPRVVPARYSHRC